MKTRWSVFILVVCTVLAILVIAGRAPSTQAKPSADLASIGKADPADPYDLFGAGNQSLDAASRGTMIMRARSVEINFDKLGWQVGDTIRLNLFDDANFTAVLDRVETNSPGIKVWVGHLNSVADSAVSLVVNGDILIGNITAPGYLYEVRYASGAHAVYQIDQGAFPPDAEPIPVETQNTASINPAAPTDSCTAIDVMVVYDAAARDAAGGTAAMQALIDLAVSETNQGYGNSGITQRINLVHAEEVSYSEAGFNWNTTLDRLTNTGDGYMDNVHTLRNTFHADETVLLVSDESNCGLAWMMTSVSPAFASHAFAVVSQSCATGYYSFAHEMGHNMGSNHDRANAIGSGAYSYSYGYQAPDKSFRTIMAYDCASPGCTRVNHWSNPDVTYNGQPTGVIYTSPSSADNRRSLNNTNCTVANWRVGFVVPTITQISPSSAIPGGPAFTLAVTGTNFITNSVVQWDGSPRTTLYVNSTRLTASIPDTDILTTGTASVTVYNPDGSGTSNALNFTVVNLPRTVYLPLILLGWPPSSGPTPGFWQSTTNTAHEFYVTQDRAYINNYALYISISGCGSYKITHTLLEHISNNSFSFNGAFYASGTFSLQTTGTITDGLSGFNISGCGTVNAGPFTRAVAWKNSSQPSVAAVVTGEVTVEPVPFSNDYYEATLVK